MSLVKGFRFFNKPSTEIDESYVGEVYVHDSPYCWRWCKFTKEDIKDETEGNIKLYICGWLKWYERKNVIFYDDVYSPMRRKVEQRCNPLMKQSKKS